MTIAQEGMVVFFAIGWIFGALMGFCLCAIKIRAEDKSE